MSSVFTRNPAAEDRGAAHAPPNKRLKLTGRGGRQSREGIFLIAAAAARSLSAIR